MRLGKYPIVITLVLMIIITPRSTRAIFGVGDVVSDPGVLGQAIPSLMTEVETTIAETEGMLKEYGLDSAAYMIAQEMGANMMNNVIKWANEGFEGGNPLYISDQKSFMNQFKDIEVLKLYSKINSISSTSGMFGMNDKNTIFSIIDSQKIPLEERLTPTVDDTTIQNFGQNFKQGGGWDTWLAINSNPQNTPWGRDMMIKKDYYQKLEESQTAAAQEAAQNNGYLSDKKCAASGTTGGGGGNISNLSNSSSTNSPGGPCLEGQVWDSDGGMCVSAGLAAGATAYGNTQQNNTNTFSNYGYNYNVFSSNFMYDPNCEQWSTQTPGSVTGSLTSQALGQQFTQIAQIDELSEIITGAIRSLSSSLINKGLSALNSGGSASTQQLGGITYTQQSNQTDTVDWVNSPYEIIDIETELPRAIKLTGEALKYLERTKIEQEKYLPLVKDLDYLLPGPDYGWEDRLNEYYNDEVADDSTRELVRLFNEAIAREHEIIENVQLQNFPEADYQLIVNHIASLADYGRAYVRTKDQLNDMRNLFYRLKNLKVSLVGNNYFIGDYNWTTKQWEGDEWPAAEWSLNINETTLNQALRTYKDNMYAIPQQGSLDRMKADLNIATTNTSEMERLMDILDQYWLTYYEFKGQEFYDSMQTLINTSNVMSVLMSFANPFQSPQDIFDSIESLVNQEIPGQATTVAERLRVEEKFMDKAIELQNLAPLPPGVGDILTGIQNNFLDVLSGGSTSPTNILKGDRQRRLYCGFNDGIWAMLQDEDLACDPPDAEDRWYRAGDFDYKKSFRPDLQ